MHQESQPHTMYPYGVETLIFVGGEIMKNIKKAVDFVWDSIRKTKNCKNLYEICVTASLKYGIPNVKFIMSIVGKKLKSNKVPPVKWYTCCYRVIPPEGDVYFDVPHLKKNTSMKNIINLPVKHVQECMISSVPLHCYETQLEAKEHLQLDFEKHVTNWKKYLNSLRSTGCQHS